MKFIFSRQRLIATITTVFFSFSQATILCLKAEAAHGKQYNVEQNRFNGSSEPLAQSLPSGAIYLGMIGDEPVYRDPINGLIIVGVGTLIYVFSSLADAVKQLGVFFAKSNSNEKPTAKECDTAKKLLTQYERLAQKYGVKIGDKRLKELNAKRDAKTITSWDLPATLRDKMPGRFLGKTLAQIESECK